MMPFSGTNTVISDINSRTHIITTKIAPSQRRILCSKKAKISLLLWVVCPSQVRPFPRLFSEWTRTPARCYPRWSPTQLVQSYLSVAGLHPEVERRYCPIRAVCNWVSKVIRNCFGFALLRCDWSRHQLAQPIRCKTKTKSRLGHTRFPALGVGYVYLL